MKSGYPRVRIIGTGSFLPNAPVPNDRIDEVLGPLVNAPPKVQKFISKVGQRMLERSGVNFRHFAVDPQTHDLTHTVASLAEEAARQALDAAGKQPSDIDLLILSSPGQDYNTPPTSAILQGRLGLERCAEMEIHSNCAGTGKSVQVAYDALRGGRYKTALIVYSQLSSVNLRGCYFNQPQMTRTQATLRYILADGSGALVLDAIDGNSEKRVPHELLGTYVESIGGKMEPGMVAGGAIADLVHSDCQVLEFYGKGAHHLEQDFVAVAQQAVPYLVDGALNMLKSIGVDPKTVDHYVYSVPSRQLYDHNIDLVTTPFGVTPEQVKFRAADTGYIGGAAPLLHFDEMVRSGEIKSGQTVVVYAVESSKWMSAGFVVRW